jgi:hypothetical protein
MKKYLLSAVVVAALSPSAHAGVVCNVTDTLGNALTYEFGGNSVNADGSFGGTMVETGFAKNGRVTVSPVGIRPIWTYSGNAFGYTLYSREAPGWALDVYNAGGAQLTHNGRIAGTGTCASSAPAQTAGNVGDLGHTD